MKQVELRRFHRVNVRDTYAQCCGKGFTGRYAVRNLSCGGALLMGEPRIEVGSNFEVLLFLPGSSTIVLADAVLRRNGFLHQQPCAAVEFASMGADDEDMIARIVFKEFYGDLFPSVLVGSSQVQEGMALSRDLKSLGYNPIRATTPLTMIRALEEPALSIKTVVIGTHLGTAEGLEFASFLADCYPHIRRVLVAHPDWSHWGKASKVAHSVINTPWSDGDLKRSLMAHPVKEPFMRPQVRLASSI